MKPAPFEYCRPDTLAEALALLTEFGDEAAILAGGLSLGAMLNMRMVRPTVVIDINRLGELARIERAGGHLRTGALVRQADVLVSDECRDALPLLIAALGHVGHYQTRSRGTLAGSVAHADPSAEIPLCLATLAGEVELTSERQIRRVPAGDFFLGALTTARAGDEMITGLLWPVDLARAGIAFEEISERQGDFAIVAAAAWAERQTDDEGYRYGLGLGGVEDRPMWTQGGTKQAPDDLAALATEIARGLTLGLAPMGDHRASADYRLHLANHLGQRAILRALEKAAAEDRP